MNKDLFYVKMQPYFDAGLVREIYSSDHVCILSVGERVYVACPYTFLDEQPYGIYMNQEVMKKIVNENRKIFPIAKIVLDDLNKHQDLFFYFEDNSIDFWKDWIKKNSNVNKIDYNLEEEIRLMSKGMIK